MNASEHPGVRVGDYISKEFRSRQVIAIADDGTLTLDEQNSDEAKLIDAARAWCLYDEQIRNADGPRRSELILARDAAGHDMRLLAGAECGCDEGTCPGLIASP